MWSELIITIAGLTDENKFNLDISRNDDVKLIMLIKKIH